MKDEKPTMQETRKALEDRFDSQSLLEQSEEILRCLQSAFPAQTVVPQGRVDLLKESLPRFGDIEKQIDELAAFLLAEFPTGIQEGGAVDNAIRLLKDNKEITKGLCKVLDVLEETLKALKDKS